MLLDKEALAKQLASLETEAITLKDQLKKLEAKRDQLREQLRPRLRVSVPSIIGKVRILVSMRSTGDRFSLTKYIEHGYTVTSEMEECITPSKNVEIWNVSRL